MTERTTRTLKRAAELAAGGLPPIHAIREAACELYEVGEEADDETLTARIELLESVGETARNPDEARKWLTKAEDMPPQDVSAALRRAAGRTRS